jgi:hypothetical protein
MGRFRTSLELAKSSWAVLREDKQLAAIPVFSFFVTLAVAALMGGAIYFTLSKKAVETGSFTTGANAGTTLQPTPVTYVVGVVAYIVITFVVTFFTAALVAGAYQRLTGGEPTLGSAFGAAGARLPQILLWSLVLSTVGLVIQAVESRLGVVGSILARGLDVAWNVVTWLAIPVIVAEGTGPIDSLKRAGGLFKKTWGENLIAQGGLGLLGLLAFLPGLVVGGLLIAVVPALGVAVIVVWLAVTATIMSALNGIFRTALYLHAAGEPVTWFDDQVLAGAFRQK